MVIDPRFDWEGDRPLRTPWNQTVIYETHVKGFTMLRPGRARGPARHVRRAWPTEDAIAHLKALGVTAVELLPVHHIADEDFLHPKGLTNYWGYSLDRLLRAALRLRRDRRRAGRRCASSRAWSRRCTAPASR